MSVILAGLHVFVCLFLIFVVLLQSAQAADLAGAFGGGGSQTALGMRGAATLLQKATTAAAVIFMLTSLVLGLTDRASTSLIEGLEDPVPAATAPAEGEQEPATEAEQDNEAGAEGEQSGAEPSESGQGTEGEQSAAGSERRPDGSGQGSDRQ